MALYDSAVQVVLSPVPCVQVTVSDSLADRAGNPDPLIGPAAGVIRTNADGTTEQVRSQRVENGDGRGVWTDYEAPQQEQVTYQAISLSSGNPAAVSSPAMLPDVGAWLIDPANPAGSVPIIVQDGGFSGWSRSADVSVTPIAGSAQPYVVESSVRQAPTGDVSLWVLDSGVHDALVRVLDSPGAKLFSWPRRNYAGRGQIGWAFVPAFTDTPGNGAAVKWGAQLSLISAARPAVVEQSFSRSWEDLRGTTWEDLRGTTWNDL